jgi:hypothetical protein
MATEKRDCSRQLSEDQLTADGKPVARGEHAPQEDVHSALIPDRCATIRSSSIPPSRKTRRSRPGSAVARLERQADEFGMIPGDPSRLHRVVIIS